MRASERVGRGGGDDDRRDLTKDLRRCLGAANRLCRPGARPLLQQWARKNASPNASGATFITAFAPAH